MNTRLSPTSRAIVTANLQPFVHAVLVEGMLTSHHTDIVFSIVIIQTYQTLEKAYRTTGQRVGFH